LIHLRFYSRWHVAYYNLLLRRLYRKCEKIVCVSAHSRQEFIDWSGLSDEHVVAIYNGVSDAFRVGSLDRELSYQYIFYPGNHRAHKNTDRLIRAYSISALPRNGVRLVFTGNPNAKALATAIKYGVPELIHFVGNVAQDRLVALYKGALAVAFVSLHEGFGLPIIEAMAAGIPVLTSTVTSMPEVSGNAALLVDPYSIDAIANGLNLLAFDSGERTRRTALGYARASQFNWDITAAKLWDLIQSVGHGEKH
jgi:glycosyltransferase involved in cell wall biosynthesis